MLATQVKTVSRHTLTCKVSDPHLYTAQLHTWEYSESLSDDRSTESLTDQDSTETVDSVLVTSTLPTAH